MLKFRKETRFLKPRDKLNLWLQCNLLVANIFVFDITSIEPTKNKLLLPPLLRLIWRGGPEGIRKECACFEQVLKLNPDDKEAWSNKGLALYNLGRYEEALACYEQVLKLNPDDKEAWSDKGVALYNLERYEEAIACYEQVLKLNPDDELAWYYKACAYALQNNLDLAIDSLQKAINLNPKYREMAKEDTDFENLRENKRFQNLMLTAD